MDIKNIAEWLINLDGKIDIHAENEEAFRFACRNGHKHIVEWLISLDEKIDIHAEDEEAFRCAYLNAYIDLAKWLTIFYDEIPESLITHKDFTGYYDNTRIHHWSPEKHYLISTRYLSNSKPIEFMEFIEYYNQTRIHQWSPEKHYLVRTKYPSKAKIIEYLYILYQSGKIFEALPMEIVFLIFKYLI